MLIIERKVGESIRIGDEIAVMVCSIELGAERVPKTRIGVSAPQHVQIDRAEIRERKMAMTAGEGPPSKTAGTMPAHSSQASADGPRT